MPAIIGVDVGGTFTDFVVHDGVTVRGRKVSTTPNQSVGVADGVGESGAGSDAMFLHGTTAGTNALLEGRLAPVALVTSDGFEDVVEIGRQARPSLYDPFVDRPPPLASREMRVGYRDDVASVLDALRRMGPEAVAVALVRSYADPSTEEELGRAIEASLGISVSVGAEISPEFREYERVATTVLNAALTPEVAGYLRRLGSGLAMSRTMVMTSAGGLLPFEVAARLAGRLVLSGPAAGVVAASRIGAVKGYVSIISFDMGGTSTDVCRITGEEAVAGARRRTAGYVNRVPALPVHTIGAGGGSIAWRDPGGALRVGPRSAGADPGPAAYGWGGTEATVTDANALLGYLPRGLMLGGSVSLDLGAARDAVAGLGSQLGLHPDSTAKGILEVVDTHMERALRMVSVEEGADPRESVLVAFGGAGGLHARRLANRLGIVTVLVPPLSGVFSALGLLLASPRTDLTRTVLLDEGTDRLQSVVGGLLEEARAGFVETQGITPSGERVLGAVRYQGQSHEVDVDLVGGWPQLREGFESTHRARFGFVRPDQPIELVNVRVEISGPAPLDWDDLAQVPSGVEPRRERARARFGDQSMEIDVWHRESLPSGFECSGPALVVERDSAVLVEPGQRLAVHGDGTLEIT